jgi:hypothetical protein
MLGIWREFDEKRRHLEPASKGSAANPYPQAAANCHEYHFIDITTSCSHIQLPIFYQARIYLGDYYEWSGNG